MYAYYKPKSQSRKRKKPVPIIAQWIRGVIKEKGFSPQQKVIVLSLQIWMDKSLYCYPARKTIRAETNSTLETIRKAFIKAEKLGWVRKEKKPKSKFEEGEQSWSWSYTGTHPNGFK